MGMDIDYLTAKEELKELNKILSDLPHNERGLICDDIIEFVNKMKEKYGKRT